MLEIVGYAGLAAFAYVVIAGSVAAAYEEKYEDSLLCGLLWPLTLLIEGVGRLPRLGMWRRIGPAVLFVWRLGPNTARWVRDRRREGELPEARVVERKL